MSETKQSKAKESFKELIKYLIETLNDSDLQVPGESIGYRILERHYADFQSGKNPFEIDAANFDTQRIYFGCTTKYELCETARIFGYNIRLVPAEAEDIGKLKGGRLYYRGANLIKKSQEQALFD